MDKEANNSENRQINVVDIKNYFKELFIEFIDLDHGVDKRATIKEIKSKQSMSGANAWMLMCSIMIASIGLNLNSQAVIIGAMLISPLMSPILGIGSAVATNDKDGLYHALLHFGAAILIALISSTLYFWLTPLNEFTQEIQSRTSPTFLDVLIAIFGGIAGIISIARKDVSTTLPGVAIATALMPPLCVTGFGIANGHFELASKAFYLFFLNSFFVAFATFVVLRIMQFPYKVYATKKDRRKNILYVSMFSFITIIPSFLIFSKVYDSFQEKRNVEQFIEKYIGVDEIYLDDYRITTHNDNTKTLLLKVYGEAINDSKLPIYNAAMDSLGLEMDVNIITTSEIKLEKVEQLESELTEVGDKITIQFEKLKEEREKQNKLVKYLQSNKDNLVRDSLKFINLNKQLKILMPQIEELGLAMVQYHQDNNVTKDSLLTIPTCVVKWKDYDEARSNRLIDFIKLQYGLDTLKLINDK